MALRVTQLHEVNSRLTTMKGRMAHQHEMMRAVDDWRHLNVGALEQRVWGGVKENEKTRNKRRTIITTHIAATTDTVVAFLSSKKPRITTMPRDPRRLSDIDTANANERIHDLVWQTIDRDRPVSLLRAITEYNTNRGVIVLKGIWLSPEERGEVRRTIAPPDDLAVEYEETVVPGGFPLLVEALDPLDCFWTLGRDDLCIEFAHEQTFPWEIVCDMFPDIYDHPDFKSQLSTGLAINGGTCKVVDYWTTERNIILIDGRIYKNAEHRYGEVPFIVELTDPRVLRNGAGPVEKVGVPFCYDMVNPATHLSWAESLSASHLNNTAIGLMEHAGIDPHISPYFGLAEGDTEPSYKMIVDYGPDGVIVPTFYGERLRYVNPPRIVDVLEVYKQSRVRDLSLVSFPESILSGAQVADVSGYAYAQMKQAAMARVEGPRMAGDRALSRLMNMLNRIVVKNWDYLDDETMILFGINERGKDTAIEVTVEDFENSGPVRVELQPEIPINKEQEEALILQKVSVGLLSKLTAMEMLGDVQDPSAEMKRIYFEKFSEQDLNTMLAVVHQYMQDNNLTQMQPRQQPQPDPNALDSMPPGVGMTGEPGAPQPSVPPEEPASGGMQSSSMQPSPEDIPPEFIEMLRNRRAA